MNNEPLTRIILSFQQRDQRQWEVAWPSEIHKRLDACRAENDFVITNNPTEADLHVTFETCMGGGRSTPPENQYPQAPAWAVVSYSDFPRAFLPGLYTSIDPKQFNANIHLSWPHWQLPNPIIDVVEEPTLPAHTEWLFSFEGAVSHRLRHVLLNCFERKNGPWSVRNACVDYGQHDGKTFSSYTEKIKQSKFILCPRGAAPYSHRILEVMALGRVPVIIADKWVPFSIPETDYFVRINERDLARIPQILESLGEYDKRQKCAVEVYQKYFSHRRRISEMMNHLCRLSSNHPELFQQQTVKERWAGRGFRRSNKLGIYRRILGRISWYLETKKTVRLKKRAIKAASK